MSIERFEEALGIKFENKEFLLHALTHKSFGGAGDYQRYEFVGDAVLDLCVAHILFELHPELPEGDLSKMRAALVNSKCLAELSRELNLHEIVRLSQKEIESGARERVSLLSDVFESFLGALYLDRGYDVTMKVVRALFTERAKEVQPTDPKTELQEIAHTLGLPAPTYKLEHISGPDHAPVFSSVVEVGTEISGQGIGNSKKESQQEAAKIALKIISENKQETNKEEQS